MPTSAKLDLYKEHKAEYKASKTKPAILTVGPARYLGVDGRGAPGSEEFHAAVGALYSMAFTIKMTRKFAGKGDYKVCHLEGLWWTDTHSGAFMDIPKEQWCWKLLIRTPDFVRSADMNSARKALREKAKPPEFENVKIETIRQGRCVQMLHVGPYCDEPATVEAMRQFAAESGLRLHGKHHEIYLSDPRRVPPQRLRTILRHPVRKA